ncbi:response regulator transcription factor [Marinicauda algicola]
MKQIVVLQCLGGGMSNREIAERLCVTEDAVKWHLRQIFKELGASNRTEAVIEAQSRGLI